MYKDGVFIPLSAGVGRIRLSLLSFPFLNLLYYYDDMILSTEVVHTSVKVPLSLYKPVC
jgi:hypothetical protein